MEGREVLKKGKDENLRIFNKRRRLEIRASDQAQYVLEIKELKLYISSYLKSKNLIIVYSKKYYRHGYEYSYECFNCCYCPD